MVLYILIFKFLTTDEKTEGSGLNGSKHGPEVEVETRKCTAPSLEVCYTNVD
jgi:hypothetical protein